MEDTVALDDWLRYTKPHRDSHGKLPSDFTRKEGGIVMG